jgi:HD superfamily phosphodiesterase
MQNICALEHGTGVSVVAGILAKELGICSDNPFKTVGLAALFHDISLYEMGLQASIS